MFIIKRVIHNLHGKQTEQKKIKIWLDRTYFKIIPIV